MTFPRPSLQSLKVFEACARHGNFTRAAEELSVTTTAVGQRIRDLEQRIGVGLFHRRGPRLSLTEAGRALGEGIREGLAVMQRAVEDCVRAKRSAERRVGKEGGGTCRSGGWPDNY